MFLVLVSIDKNHTFQIHDKYGHVPKNRLGEAFWDPHFKFNLVQNEFKRSEISVRCQTQAGNVHKVSWKKFLSRQTQQLLIDHPRDLIEKKRI